MKWWGTRQCLELGGRDKGALRAGIGVRIQHASWHDSVNAETVTYDWLMTLKKLSAAATAVLTTLALTACGGDNEAVSDAPSPSETESVPPAVGEAGGEDQILDVADQARGFCHQETVFEGVSIADSDYLPDEFQGAYVENDGRNIRHVIFGTVDMSNGDAVTQVEYTCRYLQRQTKDYDAARDSLGILNENEVYKVADRGLFQEFRDYLREAHGAEYGDEIGVYVENYEDVLDSWDMGVSEQGAGSAPSAPEVSFGNGTHLVGSDIESGTYRNDGVACYWERLSGLSGDDRDRIENDFTRGQAIVEIQPSDAAFKSQNCGSWELVE